MVALLALLVGAAPAPKPKAPAPEPPPSVGADRVDAAVQAGAAFLVTQQQPTGAIADATRFQTALTALGGLALLGAGHSPLDKSPEGVALRRATYFVLRADRQTADGYFGAADASVMHGHAVTTLFLCELLRRSADPEQEELIRRKAAAGHNFTLAAQNSRKLLRTDFGGWRYQPGALDSDVPVTTWQLLALHAGQKAGFAVPPAAGQAAAQYLRSVHELAGGLFTYGPTNVIVQPGSIGPGRGKLIARTPYVDGRGRVCYQCHFEGAYVVPTQRPPDTMLQPAVERNHFSTSAMGLLGLRICGQPNAPAAASAARFLLDTLRADPTMRRLAQGSWPFHAVFFNTLALHNFTEPHATAARQFAERNFVLGQAADGSWTDGYEGRHIGRVYCTSLALLSLEAKHRRLAIFEVP